MKAVFNCLVILLFIALGCYVGNFIHLHVLNKIGATYITPKDIAACYVLSIIFFGIVGVFIALIIDCNFFDD